MRRQNNPVVWLGWGAAVALTTIVTRNPLYLALVLMAVLVTYVSCRPRTGSTSVWGLVIKIGGVVALVSVAFNLLTAHAGDSVLFRIPTGIPIIGGEITGNALLYGISSALAIFTLIVAAATFASVVDRASLLSLVPPQMATAGVAAVIGLSFFPQTLASLRDVREAQAARGFRVRSVRDVVPLVVPVLSLGLEGAFDLAEAMESRAFGGTPAGRTDRRWVLTSGVVLTIASISSLIGGLTVPAIILGLSGAALTGYGLFSGNALRQSYRRITWRWPDVITLVTSAATATAFVAALLVSSAAVDWSPFPSLAQPAFSPVLGVACLLLVVPALTQSRAT